LADGEIVFIQNGRPDSVSGKSCLKKGRIEHGKPDVVSYCNLIDYRLYFMQKNNRTKKADRCLEKKIRNERDDPSKLLMPDNVSGEFFKKKKRRKARTYNNYKVVWHY